MRIVVFSDTHGAVQPLRFVVETTLDTTDVYLHLGDGEGEFAELARQYPHKRWLAVSGNCDLCSALPAERLLICNGVRIFMAHGHTLSVKEDLTTLWKAARKQKASIALYGHTHKKFTAYWKGIHILNPGSLSRPREGLPSYGWIDLTEAGVVTQLVEVGR